jgi:UDP-GlcNAc:undecaprenyl-phosphate GlcNAc-1-phosphate transferase
MTLFSALIHLGFALFVFALSYGITYLMIHRRWMMDHPNHRSSHQRPIPRSGGVAIVVATTVALAGYFWLGEESLLNPGATIAFGVSYGIIVLMSLIDDAKQIGMKGKLGAQLLAAVVVVSAGFWVQSLDVPYLGLVDIGWIGGLITIFWIVALTNAFNFMDGLDSLAGGQAIIAALVLALITYLSGAHFVFVLSYILAAACLGFLLHNLPPARIFMGDTGSQFLGFSFALFGVVASQSSPAPVNVLIVPILLFSFIWDTGFTLLRRKIAGDPIAAHRTHLYQLLNRCGWSHKAVAGLYHAIALVQGGLAIAAYLMQGLFSFYALAGLAVFFAIFSMLVVFKARRQGIL